MTGLHHRPGPMPPRRRRWPAMLAAGGVAVAVAITSLLVAQDRAIRAAASSSKANAARDADAVRTLRTIASTLWLADALRHDGIYGLRSIGLSAYEGSVTAAGGTLTQTSSGWTLALGGGWACLAWLANPQGLTWTKVRRGICPGAPIVASPVLTPAQVTETLADAAGSERAAFDAAFATEVVARGPRVVDLAAVVRQLRAHEPTPFRWNLNEYGLTVLTDASAACVHQVAPMNLTVRSGACP